MDPGATEDYYALLGVDAGADGVVLRRAWHKLALQWHPDHAGPAGTAVFQKIFAAYSVLADPVARAAYDRRRGTRAPPAATAADPRRQRAPGVMLARLSGPLNALLACGVARYGSDGLIELLVGAAEATTGGIATIAMRVAVHCPACGGDPAIPCERCKGGRTVEELFSAWITVPPGVADGAILRPSVQMQWVVRPVQFRVRLREP